MVLHELIYKSDKLEVRKKNLKIRAPKVCYIIRFYFLNRCKLAFFLQKVINNTDQNLIN